MAITLNKDKREEAVKEATKNCIAQIEENAINGIDTTELYLDLNIAKSVRDEIESIFDADGTSYTFLTLYKGTNQYNGRVQNFTSETFGDTRKYKIKIF